MNKLLQFLLTTIISLNVHAAKLQGKVTDEKGEPLPFASIYIKGTTKGTTTNLDGKYSYEIPEGKYVLICRYIGYQKQEIEIEIKTESVTKNFQLQPQHRELKQVVIKKGEDPAIRIVKKAIRKRSFYNKEIDAFKANAYIKGNIKLDDINTSSVMMSMMGMSANDSASKADRAELEKSKGILMLSESYNEIAYKRPDKLKIKVKSSRVSGNRSAYGFSEPIFINMYDNNIHISDQLSPRGFISPIAETAMLNYKYELLDTYQEDGKTISVIKVIPRRKFEPLFTGTINIIEEEWRLHSVDLLADKFHQLEMIDTLFIKQIFVPVNNTLMVKDQSFKLKFNILGFSITGNFVNVFTDYVFDYDTKKAFDKFVKEFDKDALSQTKAYWDNLRPVPLDTAEVNDYIKKDSIEIVEKAKKDSTKPKPEKYSFKKIVTKGYRKSLKHDQSIGTTPILSVMSLLSQFNWNTVEGFSYNHSFWYRKKINKYSSFKTNLKLRYGFSNQQLNGKLNTNYNFGKTNKTNIKLEGGRYLFQYNNNEPVNPLINSVYTLFNAQNYLKFYEAWYGNVKLTHKWINGFSVEADVMYQDRMPLKNTNLFTFKKKENTQFTENYPVEKTNQIEPRHQAMIATLSCSYQPGRKYVKYPDRIEARPSKYPTFKGQYAKGISLFGSDVNYDRWKLGMEDDMNFNLWGRFSYNIDIGGFITKESLYLADYTHFNGNQIGLASPYLNSFQLSPYYANSNTESFFTTLHAEHHFNGLLTNKIPLFRNLKYYLVVSSNAYYVNKNNNYIEVSAGLENIGFSFFRNFRVDAVAGYNNLKNPVYGIRIGVNGGVLGVSLGDDE